MSEKKPSPDNVSHAFLERADLSEAQAIRIAIERMSIANPSIKTGYDDLLAKQEKSINAILAHQKKQRAREIENTKQLLLDENDVRKRNKRVYRPRLGLGLSQSEKARAAEDDARGIVLQDEQHRIAKIERKFEEERRQFLSDSIKSLQNHTQQFNRSAEADRSHERSQGQSQDRGYDR